MMKTARLLGSLVIALAIAPLTACSNVGDVGSSLGGDTGAGDADSDEGSNSSGGHAATGGHSATGGDSGSGGAGTGGDSGSGGAGTGGAGTGGDSGSGGAGTGGAGTGGDSGSGGAGTGGDSGSGGAGTGGAGSVNDCPSISSIVPEATVWVGSSAGLSAVIVDGDGSPAAATFSWQVSAGTLSNASNAVASVLCTAVGNIDVSLAISDTLCGDDATTTVHCVLPPAVVINEVESNGGTPGDWVELYNPTGAAVDLSGWLFKDGDDTHAFYVIPAATSIAAGAYLVLDETTNFSFGLGGADSARLYAPGTIAVDSYTWAAHAVTTYGRCPNGSGNFVTQSASTKGAVNDCSVQIKINEVESNGGTPGDWIELYNAGSIPVDVSGWIFKDNVDADSFAIPASTTIAAGGYLVLEVADFVFGLGGADSARLYKGAEIIDSYSWAAHAAITYGRCPNGTGAFADTAASTKGTANTCASDPIPPLAWPGSNDVETVDSASFFGTNLSGLYYEPISGQSTGVLWGVRNGPSTLYRLVESAGSWIAQAADGWDAGKSLVYPSGSGAPDSEDVTRAELSSNFVYVATERDNNNNGVSRPSILRFDISAAGTTLTATHEWALVGDLPVVGANLGLEAITWIPDSYLTVNGFYDEAKSKLYDPADYADHGTGLFFVGLEANGKIYVYALNHTTSGFSRIATIDSGELTVQSLTFDGDSEYLWAICDNTCDNEAGILMLDTDAASATVGKFVLVDQFARPSTMPNINNEGFAIAPDSECSGGFKSVFWSDDDQTSSHAIRRDTIPCGSFF